MKKPTTPIQTKNGFKSIISYASLVTCVAFYFASASLAAAAAKFAPIVEKRNFAEEYRVELQQIETYLNNIKNLSAKFIQESEGTAVEGKFFLSRPGKMRIEYSAQPKILIVVNGSVLSYYDVELDEVSHLSTNTTPASLLTRPTISFDAKDVEITNVKKSANQIKVSVKKKNRKEAGEFSLIFNINPQGKIIQFTKMEVKNDLDQVVSVTLSDIDFNSAISDKLFVIKNKNLP